MCGLSGVMSSSVSWQEEQMFKDLFTISSLRGADGSGVIVTQRGIMKKNPAIRTLRTGHISGALANSEQLAEILKPAVSIITGHARWPTKGGTDIKAVHPHRSGHIVGVHNGTMYRVAGEVVKDGASDSVALFESIAKVGVQKTLEDSSGAYALVWVDEKEQTINFLRNNQRPLYFTNVGWQKNINTIFWSSEREMLDMVFKRTFKSTNTWDTYLPPDTWFSYPLEVAHIIKPQNVVTDVKPKAVYYPVGEWRGASGIHGTNRFNDDLKPPHSIWRHGMLPPPDVLSKQAQKREMKRRAKEAADNNKALARFRNRNGHDPVGSTSLEEHFSNFVNSTGDDISDVGTEGTQDAHLRKYTPVSGHGCAWCGEIAKPGDKVYPTNQTDLGDKAFLCWDCGTNQDCAQFVAGITPITVSP